MAVRLAARAELHLVRGLGTVRAPGLPAAHVEGTAVGEGPADIEWSNCRHQTKQVDMRLFVEVFPQAGDALCVVWDAGANGSGIVMVPPFF